MNALNMKSEDNFNETDLIAGLIQKLLPEDLKKIDKFLRSPYHNSNKKLPSLFQEICRFYPAFNKPKFTRAYIYGKLYPDLIYQHGSFRNMCLDLAKKIKAYLTFEEVKNDEAATTDFLMEGLTRRNNHSQFLRVAEVEHKNLVARENKNNDDFYRLHKLSYDLYGCPLIPVGSEEKSQYLVDCMDALDAFFAFSKVDCSVSVLNRKRIRKFNYDVNFLAESLAFNKSSILHDNVLFELNKLVVLLMKENTTSAFEKLKELYAERYDLIGKEERLTVLIVLSNFAIRHIRKGKANYQKELLDIYKFGDSENLFVSNNRVYDKRFINVIITAAACQDFKWATYFIKKYKGYLDEDIRGNALSLCKAYLYFHDREFDEATNCLLKVKSINIDYELRFRSLFIRSFYELYLMDDSFFGVVQGKIRGMKKLVLANAQIGKGPTEAYTNFCIICRDLILGRRKQTMKRKMKDMDELNFRVWLLDKVNAVR